MKQQIVSLKRAQNKPLVVDEATTSSDVATSVTTSTEVVPECVAPVVVANISDVVVDTTDERVVDEALVSIPDPITSLGTRALPHPYFQAIGCICGHVTQTKGQLQIQLASISYPLTYPQGFYSVYKKLKVEAKGKGKELNLVCYPQFIHSPDAPPQISFQVTRFNAHKIDERPPFEFKLAGLWQFVSVCQTPCVSIFKNFSKTRQEMLNAEQPDENFLRFLEPTHLPMNWPDWTVQPDLEQGRPTFVEVTAKFSPSQDCFEFLCLDNMSLEAPGYLLPPSAPKDNANIQETHTRKISQPTPSSLKKEATLVQPVVVESALTHPKKELVNSRLTSGKLELTIKITTIPKDIKTTIEGWKQFNLDCDGRLVSLTLKPKVFKKLEDAQKTYPQWTAAIAGKRGETTANGFVLLEPNLQIFERQSKQTEPT